MLELRFGSVGALRVRFAVSPAEEVLAAIRTAAAPARQPLHQSWSAFAAEALRAIEVRELVATVLGTRYFPDFLSPQPMGPTTTISDQLERIARVPARQVEAELSLAFAGRERPARLDNAEDAKGLLLSQLERCWHELLEPLWPRVSDVLAADIDYRARQYAGGGVIAVLSRLHRSVHVQPDRVTIDASHPEPQKELDDRGLLLIPRVFGWGGVGPMLLAPWSPALIYPARGRSTLWRTPEASSGLGRALGKTKAQLLAELVVPSTTTALARSLSMTAGSISAHLQDLKAAGLLTATRRGRQVFYVLSDLGHALRVASAPPT